MTMSSVAVVGAGASGTLLALHLLRHAPWDTRIALIDRQPPFGPGLAYGTGSPSHLLNVPAGRMSAFADQPRHFGDWLERQSPLLLDGAQPTEVKLEAINRRGRSTVIRVVCTPLLGIDGSIGAILSMEPEDDAVSRAPSS